MRFKERKVQFILIGMGIIITVLTVLVIVLVVVIQGKKTSSGQDNNASLGETVPEGMKYINDLYSGRLLIPDYDIPQSTVDSGKFTQAEDRILYEGAETGVDVSDHQQEIDWAKVKESGISFAFIRVGYRGFTEGGLMEDERFVQNIEGALANDIRVGVYFFSQAITDTEAVEEANYVLERIRDYDIAYPIVYDWEHITNAAEGVTPRTSSVTPEQLTGFTKAFCDTVKAQGHTPMFYSNKTMAYREYNLETLQEYGLWLAEYQPAPCFYYEYKIWQYTENATVPGIPVQVDLNLSWMENP